MCADTAVGNQDVRGISGGQKKRITTGDLQLMFFNMYLSKAKNLKKVMNFVIHWVKHHSVWHLV